ncbi:MAG: glycoside hydrolase family 43 protein [Polyangia bacterium]
MTRYLGTRGLARVEVQNPIINADFADPAVLRADGHFFLYATQSKVGKKMVNIQVARTRDMKGIEHLGDALPEKPSWASKTQDFWAPHVVRAPRSLGSGKYLMYFVAKPDPEYVKTHGTADGMAMGVAISDSPQGPFKDSGKPLLVSPGFQAIDPMVLEEGEHRILYWGSNSKPIKAQSLSADGLTFEKGSAAKEVLFTDENRPFERLLEAPWVVKKDGKYVMFASGDNCCGENAHYGVVIASASSPFGPFAKIDTTKGSGVVLQGNDLAHTQKPRFTNPGHNAMFEDATGRLFNLAGSIDSQDPSQAGSGYSRRVLVLDRVHWKNGVPHFKEGTVANGPQPGPAFEEAR